MTTHVSQGWEYCKPYPEENTVLNADTLQWKQTTDDWFGSGSFMGRIGLRRSLGGQYWYGWMQVYCDTVPTQPYPGVVGRNIYVDRMAYCSIPNYPLRWGQTSLTDGIEETKATAFATVHPNPTTGLVTVTGKDIRQAEVFNMLSQRVATAKGAGETLQVDIAKLPVGIYFVNITDGEGKKCVHKVVKE
ncbi:MAG: T9SS type A sorting domain-containing protein [Bacteroidales bacterium]|nr:T9SS type A sorting domain-containing protein [Bacteroidales bacterium]